MPQRVAAIRSVAQAYELIKEISSQGVDWGEDYRRDWGNAPSGCSGTSTKLWERLYRGMLPKKLVPYPRFLCHRLSLMILMSFWISSGVSLPSFLNINFPSLSKARTSLLSSAIFHAFTITFL
jgi:hypothetical protein